MCFVIKEHTIICSFVSESNSSLIKPLDPAAILQENRKKEQIELHWMYAIRKIQI